MYLNPKNLRYDIYFLYVRGIMLKNIATYDDITLRAFEKYCIENITEIFARNILGIFFRCATWSRILRVHL